MWISSKRIDGFCWSNHSRINRPAIIKASSRTSDTLKHRFDSRKNWCLSDKFRHHILAWVIDSQKATERVNRSFDSVGSWSTTKQRRQRCSCYSANLQSRNCSHNNCQGSTTNWACLRIPFHNGLYSVDGRLCNITRFFGFSLVIFYSTKLFFVCFFGSCFLFFILSIR